MQRWQQMDHTTTCIAMVLCLFGLMMMTSAFAVDGHGASSLDASGDVPAAGFRPRLRGVSVVSWIFF